MEKVFLRNKYGLMWKTHAKHVFKSLCCLMEHQSLVDIAICCGNKTLHAHKCILAANSHYFKEEMERNLGVEQIIVTGFDFSVLKAIIEFMYCGETVVNEEDVKYLIAAAKVLQIRGLDTLFTDRQEYQHLADDVYIPYPQFISSKPKYPIAYHPPNNSSVSNGTGTKIASYCINDPFNKKKIKRKYLRSEAEKACAKEAHASRMALAHLQKEIATTSQVNSFIIEESCTETTVENFIPHADENCLETSKSIQPMPLITYAEPEHGFPCTSTDVNSKQNILQFGNIANSQEMMPDKLKNIFGSDTTSNIEIIFKTSDGNFMTVNEEVLQNISKGGLQYQIVDENGQIGEIQDFKPLDRPPTEKLENPHNFDMLKDFMKHAKISCEASEPQNEKDVLVNNDLKTEEADLSEFKIGHDNSIVAENAVMDDRRTIQFMLLDNTEFDNNMITSFPPGVKICVEKNFIDGSEVSKCINNDGFPDFVQSIDTETSTECAKSTLKFSPDIFFADSASSMGDKKMGSLRKN